MEIRSSHYVENITALKRSNNCKSNISRGQTNNKCYMSTFCANRTRFRIDYNSPVLATMIMVVSAVAWNTRRCKAAIVTTTLQPEHQQQQQQQQLGGELQRLHRCHWAIARRHQHQLTCIFSARLTSSTLFIFCVKIANNSIFILSISKNSLTLYFAF